MWVIRLLVTVALQAPSSFASAEDASFGKGVDAYRKQNYAEAVRQWSTATLSGNSTAMNNLAYLYFNGMGTEGRVADAMALWRVAAYAGQSESQSHLGYAYEQGIGVEQDPVAAYAWYACAIATATRLVAKDDSGTETKILKEATSSLAALEGRLAPDVLASAKVLRRKLIHRYSAAPL